MWQNVWGSVDKPEVVDRQGSDVTDDAVKWLHTNLRAWATAEGNILNIYYKQQRVIRPLTCCNIRQCKRDAMLELRKIGLAIF